MCGIAAIFNYATGEPVKRGQMGKMLTQMQRRGPDGSGEWYGPQDAVGLGHRRLSIIDLSSAGAQPMVSSDGTCIVTFNGEIYNYRELRADLENRGRRFRSQSDTEILLHLYQLEGEAMLPKLRGMFAFAIWDGARRGLFMARDPLGIKPLYFADDGRTIRVASQVKALLAAGEVDAAPEPAGHVGFFLWGHVPSPYTLYRGIRALSSGSSLWVDRAGVKMRRPFFDLPRIFAEAESQVTNLRPPTSDLLGSSLRDSVQHHLVADVPVGVFLSSGLDSTTIAALASEFGGQLRTITLGFEEYKGTPNDETPLAEEVARRYGTNHQTVWVTRQDFENDLHRLLHAMDQPTSDGVNSYFISKAAAQAGLKVALSGLGGDELFGGYPSFQEIPRAVSAFNPFQKIRWLGRAARVVATPFLKHMTSPKYAGLLEYGGTYGGAYLLRRGMFMPWELPKILDGEMVREGWNELQTLARLDDTVKNIVSPHLKISALEMTWYMRHQLLRDTDWASMEHSLEVRVPFVDVELLRATAPMFAREPHPTKRDMALTPRSPLPASVLARPKTGFTLPVRQWLLDSQNAGGQWSAAGSRSGERGLRGWAREVYSTFAGSLENHRAALRRRRSLTRSPKSDFSVSEFQLSDFNPAPRSPLPVAGSSMLRVLVLLSDGFGGFGGIAKFNRDFLAALCSHERVKEVVALPRLMPEAPGPLPPKLVYNTAGLGGKVRYTRAVIAAARGQKSTLNHQPSTGGFDLIICAHIHLLPLALLLRSRLPAPCPLHLIVHGVDAWKPTGNCLANACVRRINGFISVSNVTKRRFMRWSRLRDDQGVVLPNCVDLSAFAPGPKSDVLLDRYQLRGEKVMMTLGRLASEERYKGFDEVLEAMPSLAAEIPGLCYLICGDGKDRSRLVKKAKSLGLDVTDGGSQKSEVGSQTSGLRSPASGNARRNAEMLKVEIPKRNNPKRSVSEFQGSSVSEFSPRVIFAGRISDAEKADHYRLADVYVMPSSGEGFGIVYLEALACGVPVIGSKADGGREALLNGKLGTLVDPRDQGEIIAAIRKALKQNAEKLKTETLKEDCSPKSISGFQNVSISAFSNGISVDYFSTARFERRVHDIIDCIAF